jgi:hypothetical protein
MRRHLDDDVDAAPPVAHDLVGVIRLAMIDDHVGAVLAATLSPASVPPVPMTVRRAWRARRRRCRPALHEHGFARFPAAR